RWRMTRRRAAIIWWWACTTGGQASGCRSSPPKVRRCPTIRLCWPSRSPCCLDNSGRWSRITTDLSSRMVPPSVPSRGPLWAAVKELTLKESPHARKTLTSLGLAGGALLLIVFLLTALYGFLSAGDLRAQGEQTDVWAYLPAAFYSATATPTATPTPPPFFYFADFDEDSGGWPLVDNT